jgi:hypothetical protein
LIYTQQVFQVLLKTGKVSWLTLLNLAFGLKALLIITCQFYELFALAGCIVVDASALVGLFRLIDLKKSKIVAVFIYLLMGNFLVYDIISLLYYFEQKANNQSSTLDTYSKGKLVSTIVIIVFDLFMILGIALTNFIGVKMRNRKKTTKVSPEK